MDFYTLSTLLLVLLITWMLVNYIQMLHEKSKLPPTPTPLPIIGTLYKINMKNIVQSLLQLSKTYGDNFIVYEGTRPCVVLCGYKALKETLIDKAEEFSGRGYYAVFHDFTKGNEKLHQEIDDVIGQRSPNYEDRHNMPYTEAFIHEVQRYADVAPLSLPHEMTKDTRIRNYTFPEGITFFPLLTGSHFDKTQFENQTAFNPNNFLDENGKFKKHSALMAFSVGKRICPGVTQALAELFLYVTIMLQNFTIKSLVPPEEISLVPVGVGLAHIPPNYQICHIPRLSY